VSPQLAATFGQLISNLKTKAQFSDRLLDAFSAAKIIGVRAGSKPHRFIGVWVVVVKNRVFIRPWNNKPDGWYQSFLEDPEGRIQIADREVRVRARKARGERLMDAIDLAYSTKYPTPGSRAYVKGFALAHRRATTIELLPW
jgi:hypothetical protein